MPTKSKISQKKTKRTSTIHVALPVETLAVIRQQAAAERRTVIAHVSYLLEKAVGTTAQPAHAQPAQEER